MPQRRSSRAGANTAGDGESTRSYTHVIYTVYIYIVYINIYILYIIYVSFVYIIRMYIIRIIPMYLIRIHIILSGADLRPKFNCGSSYVVICSGYSSDCFRVCFGLV